MKNVTMSVVGNKLTIIAEIDKDFGKSSSGKSIIIASTEGNVSVPEHADLKLGFNLYTRV
jgi:hypothetical protein